MFVGTWWSLMPPIIAILLALFTKEVYLSLFAGCALGALLVAEFHPWVAFDTLFNTMIDSVDFSILMFMILLGMVVMLMQESGGTRAYGEWAAKKLKSKRATLVATSLLGALIFVDDYFNCLTVGSVMRPVTDKYKVSRAKLAYLIDATAAPVCIIAPISSWAAAVNSYVPAGSSMSGFEMFVRTIPFNLYAMLTLYMVFFTSLLGFDFGLMKKHERNAAHGDLFTSGGEAFQNQEIKDPTEGGKFAKGKVIDLIAPMIVMIFTAIATMIWTGYLNTFIYVIGTTVLGMFLTVMAAYALSRKDFIWANPLMLIISFTMLFSGGIVTLYILVTQTLNMYDSRWALILPNCMSVIIISVALQIPSAIFTESFLSFIGLGVQAPMPSLGSLANAARGGMQSYPWKMLFPALAICLIVLSFNLLGDGLRDAFDPKLRR